MWIFTTQFPSLNLVLMLIRFHGLEMHLEQVCCVSLLFCWPIQRPCGTDPRRTAAFHLWPFVVSAGHSGSMLRVQPEDPLQRIYLIWPFFTSSKCFASPKLPSLGPRLVMYTLLERHQLVIPDGRRANLVNTFVFFLNKSGSPPLLLSVMAPGGWKCASPLIASWSLCS